MTNVYAILSKSAAASGFVLKFPNGQITHWAFQNAELVICNADLGLYRIAKDRFGGHDLTLSKLVVEDLISTRAGAHARAWASTARPAQDCDIEIGDFVTLQPTTLDTSVELHMRVINVDHSSRTCTGWWLDNNARPCEQVFPTSMLTLERKAVEKK